MTILQERQQTFVDTLSLFSDWNDKYNCLIEMSQAMPVFPAHLRVPDMLISGCVSRTYFAAVCDADGLRVYAASNALVPLGLAAACREIFNGLKRDEIIVPEINFHIQSGLITHLTPNRANALEQMIQRILLC